MHSVPQERRVAANGEHQLSSVFPIKLLAHAAHGFARPVGAFHIVHLGKIHDAIFLFQQGVQLFAPIRLALDIKHDAGGRGDVAQVIRYSLGLALVLGFSACGDERAFAHDHQPLFSHEGQRFTGGNERVRIGIGQVGHVHLFQTGGQQFGAKRLERLLLDVFLRAFKQVAFGDAARLDGVEKGGMVHVFTSLCKGLR